MAAEDEVRQASDHFYAVLGQMLRGDARDLDDVWSHTDAVVMPPAPPLARNVGWERVRSDFEFFAQLARDGQIAPRDRLIVADSDMAYSTQIEDVGAKMGGSPVTFTSRSSTVFRRENGVWKVALHHIDFSPELAEVVGKLAQSSDRSAQ